MEINRVSQGGQNNLQGNAGEIAGNTNVDKIVTKDAVSNSKDTGKKEVGKEDVKNAVDKLNKFLEGEQVHAVYEIHEKLNDVMIKIVNNETKEVILEIPPKKILDMVAKMCEMVGILVDKKA
ncbi:flagellar protein FlaG [Desnuesiella massiliensis]|uniref:flagellar protein FlaG n=1 Tax=Desnuesiella massiliensis TaxID=1650662 RepID=UPI0006E1655E|nr:flagellar protein FlaG [Desnuesiella massiliensis]